MTMNRCGINQFDTVFDKNGNKTRVLNKKEIAIYGGKKSSIENKKFVLDNKYKVYKTLNTISNE